MNYSHCMSGGIEQHWHGITVMSWCSGSVDTNVFLSLAKGSVMSTMSENIIFIVVVIEHVVL